MKALVMGGGMAGLVAAVNLLDLGLEVELVEADGSCGGRAGSWVDEDGDSIDNGLHLFFPCYANLLNFLTKLGVESNIIWKRPEFRFLQEGGREAMLGFADLPAPLHAVAAMLGLLRTYTGAPRWKLACAMAALGGASLYSDRRLDRLDGMTFGQWAARRAPADAFVFLEPAINGLTFTPSWMVSARVSLAWVRRLGADGESARVGFASGALDDVWVKACLDHIRAGGGRVETGQEVTSINLKGSRVGSVNVNGSEERKADVYVSSLPPFSLRSVLPAEAFRHPYFRDLLHFHYAPSLSLRVWFDRKLTGVDVAFFSHHCVFSACADLSNVMPHIFSGGSVFEMLLSPADHIEGLSDETILELATSQMRALFPAAREAEVRGSKVVRERQGTYRAWPGMESRRPYQRSPLDNLYLCGDYTRAPGSPGGMEAAVWTANHCAELIALDKLGKTAPLNVEWKPRKGFLPLVKAAVRAGTALGGTALAGRAWKSLKGR